MSRKQRPSRPVTVTANRGAPRRETAYAKAAVDKAPRESAFAKASADKPAREAARPARAARPGRTASGEVWLYGMHAVTAALRNPARKILRVVGTSDALAHLRADAEIDVPALAQTRPTGRPEIDGILGAGAIHQGIAALARTLDPDLTDVLAKIGDAPSACLMVLDQLTDPHNVGAILRSAAAFGATGVIAPERGAPDETGAMAKSASGALDVVPYIKGGNLVRVLEELKKHGFWLIGLDAEAPRALSSVDLTGRIALLVGAEGEGLRRLVRETCDHLARLPMRGPMESLNVSNAAAVALYEWTRQTGGLR